MLFVARVNKKFFKQSEGEKKNNSVGKFVRKNFLIFNFEFRISVTHLCIVQVCVNSIKISDDRYATNVLSRQVRTVTIE